jgi:hypothetical protein
MDNVSKIKEMYEWMKLNGKTLPPTEEYEPAEAFMKTSDTAFRKVGVFHTISTTSTPAMLTNTIPPEILNYTEEDINEEIDLLKKGDGVDNNHLEDFENMQDFGSDLMNKNKKSF